jgi:hypothetical protein
MDPEPHDAIDEALRALPAWTPPAGFARDVASQGAAILQVESAAPRSSWPVLHAVTAGVLAGTGAGGAAYLLEFLVASIPAVASPIAVMWMWVAVAYGLAAAAIIATRQTARPAPPAGAGTPY